MRRPRRATGLAHHVVVEINPHNGVGSQRSRDLLNLLESNLSGPLQLSLVSGGPPADNIANPREQVLKDVRAKDCFARNHAAIAFDNFPFDLWGRR